MGRGWNHNVEEVCVSEWLHGAECPTHLGHLFELLMEKNKLFLVL
jgi:hypothetical protein